jgi:hypothetical protein
VLNSPSPPPSLSLSLNLSTIQEIEVYAKQTQTDIAAPEQRDEEDEETEIPAEPVRQDTSAKNQHKDDTIQDKPVNPRIYTCSIYCLYLLPMM